MSRRRIRAGIIGCGKVGNIHAAALGPLEICELVAVCDPAQARADEFASRYGVKSYTNIEEMIEASNLDAAIVATPHPIHREPTVRALEAGVHVLCEKPLASTLEDCDLMLQAASRAGKLLGTMCQRRFFPPSQRVREAIDSGKIGAPVLATVNMFGWRDEDYYRSDSWRGTWEGEGGGVLVNQAPHQLDLLLWYMGEVDQVFGQWANLNHPYIEVDDTAVAVVRFKSGALASVLVSNSQNPALHGKVHIYGSNGAGVGVQTDGGAMFIAGMSAMEEPPLTDLWTVPGEEGLKERWCREDTELFRRIDPMEHFHRCQLEDFFTAVAEGRSPLVSGEDGRRTVELFTAIYRAQRDNAPVRFPLVSENGRPDFDGRLVANQ